MKCKPDYIFRHGRQGPKDSYAGRLVSLLVHHIGPDCNILKTIGWVAMTFGTHIHSPPENES